MTTAATDCVSFWLEAGWERWFTKDPEFDAHFRDRFLDLHYAAARREHDAWIDSADGAMALMILLDQFPRNVFRGTGHMFATDSLARMYAEMAIERGHDRAFDDKAAGFFYLPFEHSEALADQHRSVDLFTRLGEPWLQYAVVHLEIIERFGRFPHRNPALGRSSTQEELQFLDGGGFSG
jgi:uncharacterized protein (DUF924 family)